MMQWVKVTEIAFIIWIVVIMVCYHGGNVCSGSENLSIVLMCLDKH